MEISPGKGGKPVTDNKKPPTDRKGAPQNVNVNLDEDINKIFLIIGSKLEEKSRTHPNAIYWLKFQYQHLINLFKMGRYEDCIQMSSKLLDSSKDLNVSLII